MPQLKILDPRKKFESISVAGHQYPVRDGVVDVHQDHEAGARSLGFGDPSKEPPVEVGRPLAEDERAELEALRKGAVQGAAQRAEFEALKAQVEALSKQQSAPSTPAAPAGDAKTDDSGKTKASK